MPNPALDAYLKHLVESRGVARDRLYRYIKKVQGGKLVYGDKGTIQGKTGWNNPQRAPNSAAYNAAGKNLGPPAGPATPGDQAFAGYQGYRYMLVVDKFSRYAWARPLRTKDAGEVADAMQSIIHQMRSLLPNDKDRVTPN